MFMYSHMTPHKSGHFLLAQDWATFHSTAHTQLRNEAVRQSAYCGIRTFSIIVIQGGYLHVH